MGKIVQIMGKSASGKDTIYQALLKKNRYGLKRVIPYTTRPIRSGEAEGREYHFCTNEEAKKMTEEGKVIELRSYYTVGGLWQYFTADDGQIDLEKNNYILIGTPKSYEKMKEYFGEEFMVPIYIYLDNGDRLQRALNREKLQKSPNYAEMCRRYLADEEDFSKERLDAAGITRGFEYIELAATIKAIEEYLEKIL